MDTTQNALQHTLDHQRNEDEQVEAESWEPHPMRLQAREVQLDFDKGTVTDPMHTEADKTLPAEVIAEESYLLPVWQMHNETTGETDTFILPETVNMKSALTAILGVEEQDIQIQDSLPLFENGRRQVGVYTVTVKTRPGVSYQVRRRGDGK